MDILLFRHGISDPGGCSLNELGIEQTKKLAVKISAFVGTKSVTVISSLGARSIHTGHIIASSLESSCVQDGVFSNPDHTGENFAKAYERIVSMDCEVVVIISSAPFTAGFFQYICSRRLGQKVAPFCLTLGEGIVLSLGGCSIFSFR